MLQRIASKNIKSVKYCPLRMILEVQFMDEEKIYQYFDVTEEVWYNLKNASCMDTFFNQQILARYHVRFVNKEKHI